MAVNMTSNITGVTTKQQRLPDVTTTASDSAIEEIVQAVRRLPFSVWPDLMQFIEFMEYKSHNTANNFATDRVDEDQALWHTVELEQAYRRANPGDVTVYSTLEELAAALENEA
jgi:hypothetical protein